jgi:hypothetical protein
MDISLHIVAVDWGRGAVGDKPGTRFLPAGLRDARGNPAGGSRNQRFSRPFRP